MTRILIDADACPVKDEVYRVAERYRLDVVVVANGYLKIPLSPLISLEVVPGSFDAADDWIVENLNKGDVVVTADILLAQRCVTKGGRVLDPKGREFTEDNVGDAVATRELMQNLRAAGQARGGPAPMDKRDRSKFLGTLDQILQSVQRLHRL